MDYCRDGSLQEKMCHIMWPRQNGASIAKLTKWINSTIIVLWPDVKWNNMISCIYFKRRIFTISLVPWVRSRSPSCAGKPCRDLLTSTPCTRPGLPNFSTKYNQLVFSSSYSSSSYLWKITPPSFFAECTGILRGQTSSSQKTRMWSWRILACLRR